MRTQGGVKKRSYLADVLYHGPLYLMDGPLYLYNKIENVLPQGEYMELNYNVPYSWLIKQKYYQSHPVKVETQILRCLCQV